MLRRSVHLALAAILLLSARGLAQQFVHQAGAVPGPVVWSEEVEVFDANGDGWLDLVFTNGMGFNSAQGALAPTILINQGVIGTATFADETSTRLPMGFVQQGKGLEVCDVDGDGDEDIVFANAFNTQPRILINDGSGHFSDETGVRFPAIALGSYDVASGDLDGDGDLDLVFADDGGSQGGSGAAPKLFINDGTGVFTNRPDKMNGINKPGAMQVNMVDVDGDWDLDVIVDGKSNGQHLYLNDGEGNFAVQTSVLPTGSSAVYETDWADLDGDGDVDGAYVSMSGFGEGLVRNDSSGATLSFTGATNFLSGPNGNDDNETAFIDADDDGDLDLLVGSLGASAEKLYINNAGLFASGFVFQSGAFTATNDSTLGVALGDLDNDGACDVATAQGESGSFLNRIYLNSGPADSTAPAILRVEAHGPGTVLADAFQSSGLPVRAFIQDCSWDNGRVFVSAQLVGSVSKGATSIPFSIPMTAIGGGQHRAVIAAPALAEGLVNATVSYHVEATDRAGNVATSPAQNVLLCGKRSYGPGTGSNVLDLDLLGLPIAGSLTAFEVTQAAPNRSGALLASGLPAAFPGLDGTILVDISAPLLFGLFSDATGTASFPLVVPGGPGFIGAPVFVQVLMEDPGQPSGWALSNGLEIVICDQLFDPPVISTVNPVVAPAGATVTVTGSDFAPGAVLSLDGLPVAPTTLTDTQITFVVPAGLGCDLTLAVTNPDGQSDQRPFNAEPTVNSVIFPSGSAAGGATLIVQGQGFGPGTTVDIGGNSATVNSATATTLVLTTPPGTPGAATVTITNAAGCQTTTTYTYL